MNPADHERAPSTNKTDIPSSTTSPQPSTSISYPRSLCSQLSGTSLLSGRPTSIECPPQWFSRLQLSLTSLVPKKLPPRAYHHDDFLLPRDLLKSVALQHVAASSASNSDGLSSCWWLVEQRIAKCLDCNRVPRCVYLSPGGGFVIEFPECGLGFCPVCMLIDSREKVRRYCGLLGAEIANSKSAILFTLACEQQSDDTLAGQYATFQRAWNNLVRSRSFGVLVEHHIGGFHLGLQKVQVNRRLVHVWRLHFHLVAIARHKEQIDRTQADLLELWDVSVGKTSGRSSAGTWGDKFNQLRSEFHQDTPADSATRILKYMFNGFLGPHEEHERRGDKLLPIRDWPADKVLEAIQCVSKRGFQRFRASRTFRAAAKSSRMRARKFRRRRRNARSVPVLCMKIDQYVEAIDQLTADKRYLPHAKEILESLPEVYLDACLNECRWLADRLWPLLNRVQPHSQRLAGPPLGASGPVGGAAGA